MWGLKKTQQGVIVKVFLLEFWLLPELPIIGTVAPAKLACFLWTLVLLFHRQLER